MHTIYTFALSVLILAAILYIVALQFCNGKAIPIKTTCERLHISTAQNATVSQTTMGIDDFSFMNMFKSNNVLEMLTTGTFAHAQKSSTCAFHSLAKLLSILLINTLQKLTKLWNTASMIDWVYANVPLVNVQRYALNFAKHNAFHNSRFNAH